MAVLFRHRYPDVMPRRRRERLPRGPAPARRLVPHAPHNTHVPVALRVPAARRELYAEGSRSSVCEPAQESGLPPGVFDIELKVLSWSAPFQWLAAGWRDFARAPTLGFFYGGCFVVMGWLLMAVFRMAPAYTLALSAGFLLAGPFLCLGLYDASRALAQGRAPRLGSSLSAWRARSGQMAIFGGVLLILEMLWGRAAMIVFALSFEGMPDFQGSLLKLLDPEHVGFIVAYLGVGALFAGLIYALSVVSMPMMLDRQVDAITAGLTSLRLVSAQPGVMLLWGGLITFLVVLAMLPGFAGLLLVGPWVGHASWHAYKAAVGQVMPRATGLVIREG